MNTNLGKAGGWTTSFGAHFGGKRCEIHVRCQSGVNVAHAFDVHADGLRMRDSGMEFLGATENVAFGQAYAYLSDRYGLSGDRFFPTNLQDRTILPAWPAR